MYTRRFRPCALAGLFAALTMAAASVASAPAGPAETSIYGITLGEPFTAMQECPFNESQFPGATRWYKSVVDNPYPCFQHLHMNLIGEAPTGTERLFITYPTGKSPEMYDGMDVSLIDGIVQRIDLGTRGVDSQGHDYALLERKFGKPLTKRTVDIQNRMGSTVVAIEANWQRPGGVSLMFRGATDQLDEGELIVTTPQEGAREQAQEEQHQEGVPKL